MDKGMRRARERAEAFNARIAAENRENTCKWIKQVAQARHGRIKRLEGLLASEIKGEFIKRVSQGLANKYRDMFVENVMQHYDGQNPGRTVNILMSILDQCRGQIIPDGIWKALMMAMDAADITVEDRSGPGIFTKGVEAAASQMLCARCYMPQFEFAYNMSLPEGT